MMKARATQNASVEKTRNGWLLRIPEGDALRYRFAQLDDYFGLSRRKFPHHSLSLSLRARASSSSLPGTWGFGLWNDPFGVSLGFGGNRRQVPALPNAAWFFSASKENYLSFKSPSIPAGLDTGGKSARPTQPAEAAHGFLAQSFRSPKFHPLLIPAGFAFPFSGKTTRKLLGKVINEDSAALSVDVTQWHGYRLEWSPGRVVWYVDQTLAFESPVSPNPPLGLVIWIDNQFAAFTPEGRFSFGVLEGPEAWIEVADVEIHPI